MAHRGWRFPTLYPSYLVGVDSHSCGRHDVPQVADFLLEQSTLLGLKLEPVLLNPMEDLPQVAEVIRQRPAVHDDVVQIYQHTSVQEPMQNLFPSAVGMCREHYTDRTAW